MLALILSPAVSRVFPPYHSHSQPHSERLRHVLKQKKSLKDHLASSNPIVPIEIGRVVSESIVVDHRVGEQTLKVVGDF